MTYDKLHIFNMYNLMSFDISLDLWNHHHNEDSEYIHHLPSFFLPLYNPSPSLLLLSTPTFMHLLVCFLPLQITFTRILYERNHTIDFTWLFLLSTIILGYIHAVAHSFLLFFWTVSHSMDTLIYSDVDRHLGY